jgi:hypothetical protein
LNSNSGIAWEAGSITLWQTTFTLAGLGASITINSISIIAFLSDSTIPFSITTSGGSSTTSDDVWKTGVPVAICLGTRKDNTISNGNGLETVDTDGWVSGEGFVNRARPVRKVSVGQGINCRRRCDDVNLVVARELSANFERSKVRESLNSGYRGVVIILRERKVKTGI